MQELIIGQTYFDTTFEKNVTIAKIEDGIVWLKGHYSESLTSDEHGFQFSVAFVNKRISDETFIPSRMEQYYLFKYTDIYGVKKYEILPESDYINNNLQVKVIAKSFVPRELRSLRKILRRNALTLS